ncbi:MAG TPA: hypothetical protein VJ724_04210 [Tahibacter sp.]|nr:hypothetical protein [Tahibacter sp.]
MLASAVALSFSASADTLPPDIVERGDGWELMLVAPPVDGAATASLDPAPIVSVSSADGLAASPLPQSIKDELAADFAGGEEVVVNVRQDLAQAFADGTAEQQFGEFVEPDEATGGVGASASAICDGGWRERHLTRSRSFDGFSHTFSESAGNFRGNLAFAVPLSGEASVDVTYAYRKKFCIPWAVKFVNARVAGVLDVGETLFEANGTATFEKSDRVVVAKPAFEDTFTIGPVPVRIGVEFPLGVGYDIKATASAQLALKSRAQGELRFDLTCTRGGCTRNAPADNASTVTFDDLIHPTVAGSASVQLDAKPYAFVEANAWLYHDALAKAGLGLEVSAPSRLFYYVGNQ